MFVLGIELQELVEASLNGLGVLADLVSQLLRRFDTQLAEDSGTKTFGYCIDIRPFQPQQSLPDLQHAPKLQNVRQFRKIQFVTEGIHQVGVGQIG